MTVAVVTRGGRGLGRALSVALSTAGWTVAAVARSSMELAETVRLVEKRGGTARAFVADVSDAAAVETAIAAIERSLGAIDLLVNNAGVPSPLGPLMTSTLADWWRTLEVNLLGQVNCAHRVLPGMIARRAGRIVNIASGGGAYMLANFPLT